MKKLLSIILCVMAIFTLFGCGNNQTSESQSESVSSTQNSTTQASGVETSTPSSSETSSSKIVTDADRFKAITYDGGTPIQAPVVENPTIFLAGDSTVKTYEEKQYIAGWGQYLQAFLNAQNVTVVNKANGGRSSRSFINEGRLFTQSDRKYTSYTSIESEIKAGDYLMIQFGHNDEETNGSTYSNYIDRKVPLGTADQNGIFPTVLPYRLASTNYAPVEYENYENHTKNDIVNAISVAKTYGDYYYSFDCGVTFKGYLKMYIDFARSKGAIPILCTPVARVKFDSAGTTLVGGNGKHGPNFEYVQAVRQLAQEENCLLIDTFNDSKVFLETATATDANYLMALKPNGLSGTWPNDYDSTYGNTSAGYTGIEATHYNKYGAYIQAAKIAEAFLIFSQNNTQGKEGEKINFASSILTTPTSFVTPSSLMQATTVSKIEALFTQVKISA